MSTLFRCTGQVLHHRAFVGHLKLPIATNAIAALTLAGGAMLLWTPLCDLFANDWPILDGWRQAQRDRGPTLLLLTTIWLLWPVWFEVVTSAAVEPLVTGAEVAIGGPGMRPAAAAAAASAGVGTVAARVHRRARLLALQILLLPLAWVVALLPIVGLPLTFLGSAALAAMVWLEVPAERRGIDHRQHFADLRRNWPRALGYGAALQLAVLVPLLNVLLLAAAAAVSATVLHFQFDKSDLDKCGEDGPGTTENAAQRRR